MNSVHTFWYQYSKALVEAEKNIKAHFKNDSHSPKKT